MNAPAKVSFTDPDLWHEVHRARTSGPPTDEAGIRRWIHLQHVPTHYDGFVADALDAVLEEHQGTTESALAITGMKHLGKSDATTAVLLHRAMSDGRWQQRSKDGFKHVPFVFVEAKSHATGKAVLKAALRFLGLPTNGDEDDLVNRVAHAAPSMGVRALVVDESQNFRRSSGTATTITDGLRVLTHLPFPVAFIGIDLPSSALLKRFEMDGDSVDQLIARINLLELRPAGRQRLSNFPHVIRALDERLSLIDGFDAPALRSNEVMRQVILDADGRPGAVLERIKKGAAAALAANRSLDESMLSSKSRTTARRVSAA